MKSDRISQIKHLLLQKKSIQNDELCRHFGVSIATIRRDLDKLEEEGFIRRFYGGAQISDHLPLSPLGAIEQWDTRAVTNVPEKRAMAELVAAQIPDHCTVLLDSGTTVFEVARRLIHRKNLTVLTNSLTTAAMLGACPDLQVYCIGGLIKTDMLATSGILSAECLSFFPTVDISVFSADSYVATRGIMAYSMELAMLKKAIAERSDTVIAAVDHTKFGLSAGVTTCPTRNLHMLVTDSGAPPEDLEYTRHCGVKVLVANV